MRISPRSPVDINWEKIKEEVPEYLWRRIRYLGEGWDFIVYLVDERYVFRFPKHARQWAAFHREIRFLASVASALPVTVPYYRRFIRHSAGYLYGYAIYEYIPGNALTLDGLTRRERLSIAGDLASFLRALHRFKPPANVAMLLSRDDERKIADQTLRCMKRYLMPLLSDEERQKLQGIWLAYRNTPANFHFRPVVLHADFSADHILMLDRKVMAVIDFGDVNWGHADYDFTYLYMHYGSSFVRDVARRYSHKNIERLMANVRYYAIADQLSVMLDPHGHALPGQQQSAWKALRALLASSGE